MRRKADNSPPKTSLKGLKIKRPKVMKEETEPVPGRLYVIGAHDEDVYELDAWTPEQFDYMKFSQYICQTLPCGLLVMYLDVVVRDWQAYNKVMIGEEIWWLEEKTCFYMIPEEDLM